MTICRRSPYLAVLLPLDPLPHIPTNLRLPFYHIRKPNLLPAPLLTQIPHIGHTPPFQMPLLDTPNDIHRQLPILLQGVLPVCGDCVRERQVARHGADHHLPHLVVLRGIAVDVLHAAQGRVGFVGVVEGAQGLDDFLGKAGDLELLRKEVEVQERADLFFGGRVAEGFAVEPADEELAGKQGVVSQGCA